MLSALQAAQAKENNLDSVDIILQMVDVVELQPDDAHVSGKYGICADIDIITYDIRLTKGKRGRRRTGGGGCRGRRRGGGRRREKRQDLYFYSNLICQHSERRGRKEDRKTTRQRVVKRKQQMIMRMRRGKREVVHTAVVQLQLSVFTFARKAISIEICRERWVPLNIPHQHKFSPFSIPSSLPGKD